MKRQSGSVFFVLAGYTNNAGQLVVSRYAFIIMIEIISHLGVLDTRVKAWDLSKTIRISCGKDLIMSLTCGQHI